MLVTLKQTKVEEKQVDIDLPAYFRNGSRDYVAVLEDGSMIVASVAPVSLVHFSAMGGRSQSELLELLISGVKIQEREFKHFFKNVMHSLSLSVYPEKILVDE